MQGQEELPEDRGMTFNSTFTGMPRMNALFERMVKDGIITENPVQRSGTVSEKSRNEDGRSEHRPSDRDTEIDNVPLQKR